MGLLRLTEHLRAWPSARSEVPPVPEPPRFQGNQVSICCPFQISMRCSGPCPQRWQAWAKIVRVVGSIRPHLPGGSSPRLVLHSDLTPAGTSTSAYCNRKIHTQRDSAQNKKTTIQANQHTEVNSWSVIMPWPTSEPPSQGPGAWASPGKNSAEFGGSPTKTHALAQSDLPIHGPCCKQANRSVPCATLSAMILQGPSESWRSTTKRWSSWSHWPSETLREIMPSAWLQNASNTA